MSTHKEGRAVRSESKPSARPLRGGGEPPRLADLNLSVVAWFSHSFLIIVSLFLIRACDLQLVEDHYSKKLSRQRTAVVRHQAIRGDILDRNSQVLAQNVKTYRIAADPSMLSPQQIEELLTGLPKIFPKIDVEQVRARLSNQRRRDALLWRHATYDEYQEVKKLTNTFIGTTESTRRIYPKGELAGPLLGFVSIIKDHLSSEGRAGIEQAYDWALSGEELVYESQRNGLGRIAPVSGDLLHRPTDGRTLMTTIDMRLQQITEAYLSEQVKEMEAIKGVAVVMDPNNGDILAVAQVPSYDPNRYFEFPRENHHNFFISSQAEPGSTMKPFLVAAALNENVVSMNTRFSGMGGQFKLGRFTIKDSHSVEDMSTLEIIKYSSNVGAIQLAQLVGKHSFYSYLKNFGFGELTQIRLSGEASGKVYELKDWNPVNLGTMSYGYGISVTPIQMVQALSVIANGGELIAPRVVRAITNKAGEIEEEFPVRRVRRVISSRVAQQVTQGMMMVTQAGGTAPAARVHGYQVAGKTGTAHKAGQGGYSEAVVASFMGFVPAERPRLAIYISIDEPKKEKYGGKVAAPVFAKIVSEALPFLGVPPDDSIQGSSQARQDQSRRAKTQEPETPLVKELDHTPWWSKDRFLMRATDDMVVPDVKGLNLVTALERLKVFGLDVTVKGSGIVTSQSPESGELLPAHDRIELTLEQPSLLNRTPTGASLMIEPPIQAEPM